MYLLNMKTKPSILEAGHYFSVVLLCYFVKEFYPIYKRENLGGGYLETFQLILCLLLY